MIEYSIYYTESNQLVLDTYFEKSLSVIYIEMEISSLVNTDTKYFIIHMFYSLTKTLVKFDRCILTN